MPSSQWLFWLCFSLAKITFLAASSDNLSFDTVSQPSEYFASFNSTWELDQHQFSADSIKLAEGCGSDLNHRIGRLQKQLESALTSCDWNAVRKYIGPQFSFSVIGTGGGPCVSVGGLVELMMSHEDRSDCLGNMEFKTASKHPFSSMYNGTIVVDRIVKNYKIIDTSTPSDHMLSYHWTPTKGSYQLAFITGHDTKGPSNAAGLQSCREGVPLSSDQGMDLVLRLQAAITTCDLRSSLVASLEKTPSTINEPCEWTSFDCIPTGHSSSMVLYNLGCLAKPAHFSDPQYISETACGPTVKLKSTILVSNPSRTFFIEYTLDRCPSGTLSIKSILIYRNFCLNPVDLSQSCPAHLEPSMVPVREFQIYMAKRGSAPAPLDIVTASVDTCTDGECCVNYGDSTQAMFASMGLDGYKTVNSAVPILQTSYPSFIYVATTNVGSMTWTVRYTVTPNVDGRTFHISSLEVFTLTCPLPAIGTPYNSCSSCARQDAAVLDFQAYMAQRGSAPTPLTINTVNTNTCPIAPNQCCQNIDSTTQSMFALLGLNGIKVVTSTNPILQSSTPTLIYLANTTVGLTIWTIRYIMALNPDGKTYRISSLEVFSLHCPLPSLHAPYCSCSACPTPNPLDAINVAIQLQQEASACYTNTPLIDALAVTTQIQTSGICHFNPNQCCNTIDPSNKAVYLDLFCAQHGNATTPVFISSQDSGNIVTAGSSVKVNGVTYRIVYVLVKDIVSGQFSISLIKIGIPECPINDNYVPCHECSGSEPLSQVISLNAAIASCQAMNPQVRNLATIPSTLNSACYGAADYCCATTSPSSEILFTLSCSMVLFRIFSEPVLISGTFGDNKLIYQATLSVTRPNTCGIQYIVEYTFTLGTTGYQLSSILIYQSTCMRYIDFNNCSPTCPNPAIYAVEYFQDYLAQSQKSSLFILSFISSSCMRMCCMTTMVETDLLYSAMGINNTAIVTSTTPVLEVGSSIVGNPVYLLGNTTVNGNTWTIRYTVDRDLNSFNYQLGKLQVYQTTCPFSPLFPQYPECDVCNPPDFLISLDVILQLQLAAKSCDYTAAPVMALGVTTEVSVSNNCSANATQCCNSISPSNAAVYMDIFCTSQAEFVDIEIIAQSPDDTLITLSSSIVLQEVPTEIVYETQWNWITATYDIILVKIGSESCPVNDSYINCHNC